MVSNIIKIQQIKLLLTVLVTMFSLSMTHLLSANGVKLLLNNDILENVVQKIDDDISAINTDKEIPKKKFTIVIDAGHGGHDSGAVGKNSVEKDLVLKMAKKTRDKLKKQYPEFEVLLTRDTDDFIPLFTRVQYANDEKADLFISIHCNHISSLKTRGTETYVMGLHRAAENLEVAKRENSSILLEKNYENNYDGFDPNSPEGHIILSMYQNNYLDKSIEIAAAIENEFSQRHLSKSRGVKQAGFAVLRRASMPAVLVEAGFLSNDIDEAYLLSNEGQDAIAESLVKAISTYYTNNVGTPTEVATTTYKNANTPVSEDIQISNYYRVQIAALRSESIDMNSPEVKKIGTMVWQKSGDFFKCQVGDFLSRESAEIAREKLRGLGYTGAFIVEVK